MRPGRPELAVSCLVIAALVGMTSGCASSADLASASAPSVFDEALSQARANAGTSDTQLEILERAATTGNLPFEDYAASVNATLECLRDGGVTVSPVREVSANGVPALDWGIQEPAGTDAASGTLPARLDGLIDSCDTTHRVFVEIAYHSQASSMQVAEAYFEARLPEVVQCAAEKGFVSDSSMSAHAQLRAIALSDNPDVVQCASGFAWL